jgi:hypothetical protein
MLTAVRTSGLWDLDDVPGLCKGLTVASHVLIPFGSTSAARLFNMQGSEHIIDESSVLLLSYYFPLSFIGLYSPFVGPWSLFQFTNLIRSR